MTDNDEGRSAFRKDYSRLLHAPSFRRLQGKTQLFPGSESDFFRNRLTHSLEVAQIASGIADLLNSKDAELGIDRDLVQFAAIAHDLGHPPFGHNGESALDQMMRDFGGFEGNAQTLRILTCTERKLVWDGAKVTSEFGLDLTFRTLGSILKYDKPIPLTRDVAQKLLKGYYLSEADLVNEVKKRIAPLWGKKKFKTVECWIMDIADDIAYSTYDLEDSLHAGFVSPLSLLSGLFSNPKVTSAVTRKTNEALAEAGYDLLSENELLSVASTRLDITAGGGNAARVGDTTQIEASRERARIDMVNSHFRSDTVTRTRYTAERVGELIHQAEIVFNADFPALSVVRLNRSALVDVEIFKHLNYELVIRSPKLAVVQHRGREIVEKIFKALIESNGDLLPARWQEMYKEAGPIGSDEENASGMTDAELKSIKCVRMRLVCDYVAGMTDKFAVEFYDSLFGEGKGLYGPV